MNIFDLSGPEFLEFYFLLMVIGALLAWLLRTYTRFPGPGGSAEYQLDPLDVAFLAGNARGVANAMVAGMIHRGFLKADAPAGRIRSDAQLPADAGTLERRLFAQCDGGGARLGAMKDNLTRKTAEIEKYLQSLKLVLPSDSRWIPMLAPPAIMLAVLTIGLIKIGVGITRERPVGLLVLLCFVTAAIAVPMLIRPVWRTRRADAVLRDLRRGNAALRESAASMGHQLSYADIMLALSLFGPAILVNSQTGLSGLSQMMQQSMQPGSSGSSGSWGSWGSSCSSSSGCGGGGGGGGGCGGCGGGSH